MLSLSPSDLVLLHDPSCPMAPPLQGLDMPPANGHPALTRDDGGLFTTPVKEGGHPPIVCFLTITHLKSIGFHQVGGHLEHPSGLRLRCPQEACAFLAVCAKTCSHIANESLGQVASCELLCLFRLVRSSAHKATRQKKTDQGGLEPPSRC